MWYLAIASIFWSFSFSLVKLNLTDLSPDFVTFLRMLFAFLIFFFFYKPQILDIKQKFQYMCIGAIQYGIMHLFCIRSYAYLAAHQVVLFTAFTPFYVLLIDGFYNQNLKFMYFATSLVAFLGCALIYYEPSEMIMTKNLFKGFILVQMADICFAFGQVYYKIVRQKSSIEYKDYDIFALLFLGAIIITASITSLSGGWVSFKIISLKQFLIITYLGSVPSGICFFMWNKGATIVNTSTLAIFNNCKIPLGIFVSIVIFKEYADLLIVSVSLSLLIVCIVIQEIYNRRYSN